MSFVRVTLMSTLATASLIAVACSSGDDASPGTGGAAGTGGTGASAGSGNAAGSAQAGKGGGAGTTATGGGAGTSAGRGGNAGSGAVTGGSAGSASGGAGSGGTAGATGGSAGSIGEAGMGGEGTGGTAGGGGSSGGGTAGSGTAGSGTAGGGGSAGGGPLTLALTGFAETPCSDDDRADCAVWPREMQAFMAGDSISPAMTWTNVPAGTQSLVIVHYDISVDNVHWVLWNIPAGVMNLAANVPKTSAMPNPPAGAQQAGFSTGDGYFGPGSECNVYEFRLYALSIPTFSPTQATDPKQVRTQLLALDDQILGQDAVVARQDFNGTCNP